MALSDLWGKVVIRVALLMVYQWFIASIGPKQSFFELCHPYKKNKNKNKNNYEET